MTVKSIKMIRASIYLFYLIIFSSTAYADKMNNKLTDFQEYIIKGGTEPAFKNEYWSNKAEGIYVDIVSGVPLFSSIDKYDSYTGWPSFTKPISEDKVVQKTDNSFGMKRVEVKSRDTNSHLGHMFDDGPKEEGGKRYCINSAALKFISKNDLQKEGYGEYLKLFDKIHK